LFRDSALLDRIFRVFDGDDNNLVDFPEYVKCLSVISTKGSKDSKLKCKLVIYPLQYLSTSLASG
jgi:Ca2+-binding EF-hand superfamily protein